MKYIVYETKYWRIVAEFDTIDEANKAIDAYNELDRLDWTFTEWFYEIRELQERKFKPELTDIKVTAENLRVLSESMLNRFRSIYPIDEVMYSDPNCAIYEFRPALASLSYDELVNLTIETISKITFPNDQATRLAYCVVLSEISFEMTRKS